MPGPIVISAFYKFVAVDDCAALRRKLSDLADVWSMAGTILIAPEGINGTIAGERQSTDHFFGALRRDERFSDIDTKESFAEETPFKRTKVRLKKEIVTLRRPADPRSLAGTHVDPLDWNGVISDPKVLVIDTRNREEVELGTFAHAVDPETESFTEFADFVPTLDPEAHPRVAMFCTGGIRCAKASSYMLSQGFNEVLQLDGGILGYLEVVPADDSLWQGECFVFDERVTVDHNLEPGSYVLCRGCRHPLSEEDVRDRAFEAGVSCRHCAPGLNQARRDGLRERQRQETLARAKGQRHIARRADDGT